VVNADKKRISLQENRSNKFIRDGKRTSNRSSGDVLKQIIKQ
jgi:hypothetical protein